MTGTPSELRSVNFEGVITALSDIAVSPPDHSKKVGLSTVSTLPRKRYADGTETIYLPATTIRGRIRNLLTTSVMQILHEKSGKQFTPRDYLFTASGGIKDRATANSDDREVDLAGIEAVRTQNPVISLFGAMTMKIAGKAMVGDAVPSEPVQPNHLGRSVRAHPLQRSPELLPVLELSALEAFRKLDTARARGNVLEDEAENLEKKATRLTRSDAPDADEILGIREVAKERRAEAKAAFDEAGGAVNIQQLLGGYEAIPMNTRLGHSMRLREVTEDELAFMLLGLQLLAFDPFIGAHRAQGHGEIEVRYKLSVAGKREPEKPAGEIRMTPFAVLEVETSDPFINAAAVKARQWLSGEGLDAFSFGDAA